MIWISKWNSLHRTSFLLRFSYLGIILLVAFEVKAQSSEQLTFGLRAQEQTLWEAAGQSQIGSDDYLRQAPTIKQKLQEMETSFLKDSVLQVINLHIGMLYLTRRKHDTAMTYLDHAMRGRVRLLPKDRMRLYHEKAVLYNQIGKFDKGFSFARAFMVEARLHHKYDLESKALTIMGVTLGRFGHKDQVLDYYRQALSVARQQQNPKPYLYAYIHLIDLANRNAQYDTALHYIALAKDLAAKTNEHVFLNDVLINEAEVLYGQGNAKEALSISLDLQDSTKWKVGPDAILQHRYMAAKAMIKLGQIGRAIQYSRATFLTYAQAISPAMRLDWLNSLATWARLNGDPTAAFDFLKQHNNLKDSILNAEQQAKIVGLESQYRASERTRQNEKLKAQLLLEKDSRIIELLSLVVALICATLLVVILIYRWHLSRKKAQAMALRLEANELQQSIDTKAAQLVMIQNELLQQKAQALEESLSFKQRELAATTAFQIRKNQLLETIVQQTDASRRLPPPLREQLDKLKGFMNEDDGWGQFKRHFEEVHPDFFIKLSQITDELTLNDLRVASYIKMKIGHKEIATLMSVTDGSLRNVRTRLRKKLRLADDQDLNAWIEGL